MQLAYGACRLEALADDDADLAWLRDFLCPWFEPQRGGDAPLRVTLRRDGGEFASARAAGAQPGAAPVPAFLADGQALALVPWASDGAPRWFDAGADALLEREGEGRWRVLAAPGAHFARVAWMRVLRELATLHAAGAGAALVHASAVERGGRAIAFVGPKRSGKTSCLLASLRVPGVRFLANDRLCLEGDAVARGMPTIVSLRDDPSGAFPELARRVRAADSRVATRAGESRAGQPEWPRKPGHAGVAPGEFLALAGVPAAVSAPLAAWVFPSVSGQPGRTQITRLSPAETEARLHATDLLRGAPPDSPIGSPPAGAGAAALARAAAQVPGLACRLDLDAYVDPAALLDAITASG